MSSTNRVVQLAHKLQLKENARLYQYLPKWLANAARYAEKIMATPDAKGTAEGFKLKYILNHLCPSLHHFNKVPDARQFRGNIKGLNDAMFLYEIENTQMAVYGTAGELVQEGVTYDKENLDAFLKEVLRPDRGTLHITSTSTGRTDGLRTYFLEMPPMPAEAKADLLRQLDQWYGDTDQDLATWAPEYQLWARMLLQDTPSIMLNPQFLEVHDLDMTEVLNRWVVCPNYIPAILAAYNGILQCIAGKHEVEDGQCFDVPYTVDETTRPGTYNYDFEDGGSIYRVEYTDPTEAKAI